jgi:Gpi18-like mannosyltransferase
MFRMDALVLFLLILESALALWLLYREGLLKGSGTALLCTVLVAVAFALRAAVFDYETDDYRGFLHIWVEYYRSSGGFRAFAELPFGCNYHVPYLYFLALFSYLPARDLYLIKLLSVAFDVLIAWAVMKLVGRVTKNPVLRAASFLTVLYWPTILLNGALWGQCDSIYVAFALLGIWLALEDRPVSSMVMMAFSFCFKLQSVFVLPICAVLLIAGKYKWKHLLIFPLTYVLLLLPAVLLGCPLWDTLIFYAKQTGSIGEGLNYNSPSIFAIFWNIPDERRGSAAAMAVCAAVLYLLNLLGVAYLKRKSLTDRSILLLALLMAIGIPFLLPHMHDRYFFAADVLSLAVAFAIPPLFLTAPLAGFASFLGYYAYLSMNPHPLFPRLSSFFAGKGPRYLLPMYDGSAALLIALALSAIGLAFSFRSGQAPKGKRRKN